MRTLVSNYNIDEIKTHLQKFGLKIRLTDTEPPFTKGDYKWMEIIWHDERRLIKAMREVNGLGDNLMSEDLHLTEVGFYLRRIRCFRRGVKMENITYYNYTKLIFAIINLGVDKKWAEKAVNRCIVKNNNYLSFTVPNGGQKRIYVNFIKI